MPFREVANLDEDEFIAVRNSALDHARRRAWSQTEEVLANLVDSVNALRAEINAGLTVVMVKHSRKPDAPTPYPRPDWIQKTQSTTTEVVMRPGELFRKMRKPT